MSSTAVLTRQVMTRNETSHCLSGGVNNQPYNMQLVLKPYSRVTPGSSVCPPLVVKIDGHSQYTSLANVWAYVSLTSETGAALPPSVTGVLRGNCCESLQFSSDTYYAVFNTLAVSRPGRYRIRISLIEMSRPGQISGGRNIQQAFSEVITVDPSAEKPRICEFSL